LTTQIVVGGFTPSVLLSVARRTGRLDEAGLEVRETLVPSSPAQFRSLLGGEIDLAFTSPDNVLAYRFSPANPLGATYDVSIVSTVDAGLGLGLYARPGLESVQQLRGGVLGVDVAASGFALAMYALCDSVGIGRDDYELVALGSTPNRRKALVSGDCDATMLNAGNELVAERDGCRRLLGVADVCSPYVGTVLCVHGREHLAGAQRLADALRLTARDISSGKHDELAGEEAVAVLGLDPDLAVRYVERLKSEEEGLIRQDGVDLPGLWTIVSLRRRFLPEEVDGVDVLANALDPASGLLAPTAGTR
jgi:ABC-type nitrate/sulfonate/bicarbonate transport system substrate-binding protein